jgi:hypothetical protein
MSSLKRVSKFPDSRAKYFGKRRQIPPGVLRFYFAIEPGESSSAVSMSPLSQNHIIFDEESHSADS